MQTKEKNTFGGLSLHHIDPSLPNPYQLVIGTLGRTLEVFFLFVTELTFQRFDDDKLIPVFGSAQNMMSIFNSTALATNQPKIRAFSRFFPTECVMVSKKCCAGIRKSCHLFNLVVPPHLLLL